MAAFRYRAATASGEVRAGVLEAGSAAEALNSLRRLGLLPIEAVETRARADGPAKTAGGVPRQAVINVLGELAVLLDAGMTLDRALAVSVDNAQNPVLKAALGGVRDRVKEGAALSRALRAQGGLFPPLACAMAEAGEANGELAKALTRLAETLDREEALRRTIVSALIYPALLVVVATSVICVVLLYVVPQFETLFSDSTVKLPFATRMVMGASRALRAYGLIAAGLIVATVLAAREAMKRPDARRGLERRLLSAPVVGPLIAKAETARFARVLASLVEGGVPLPTALNIAKRSLSNSHMAEAVGDVADGLKEGAGLSRRLAETRLFPPMAISFLRTGEETARLGLMLTRLADVLDREVRTTLQRLVDLITPVVTLVMAALVGGIIASLISAILGFNDLALSP